MTDHVLCGILEDIYAAFGKSAPAASSRYFESVRRRTAHIPDDVAFDLRAQLEGQGMLPQNIGLALQNAWDAWLLAHPERGGSGRAFCGDCHGGYRIFVSPRQPFGAFVRCVCNGGDPGHIEYLRRNCAEVRHGDLPPAALARRYGWLAVRPDADDGCFARFGPMQAMGVDAMTEVKAE